MFNNLKKNTINPNNSFKQNMKYLALKNLIPRNNNNEILLQEWRSHLKQEINLTLKIDLFNIQILLFLSQEMQIQNTNREKFHFNQLMDRKDPHQIFQSIETINSMINIHSQNLNITGHSNRTEDLLIQKFIHQKLNQTNNWIPDSFSRNKNFRIKTLDNKIDTIVNNNLKSIYPIYHR